jgi:toxin ParE1/3/4
MKVRYTIDALFHIAEIHSYINERNPVAASRVVARIRSASEQLGESPRIGHAGATAGTREWAVVGLPFIIVHELRDIDDEVVVLGVYHGARLRPGQDT